MKNGQFQAVLANIKLTVDLPHHFRGAHMSCFIEVLNQWIQQPISNREIKSILTDMRDRNGAEKAQIDLKFKCFLERKAPVSGLSGLLDYDCLFLGELDRPPVCSGCYDTCHILVPMQQGNFPVWGS